MEGWAPGSDAVRDVGGERRRSSLLRRGNRLSVERESCFLQPISSNLTHLYSKPIVIFIPNL